MGKRQCAGESLARTELFLGITTIVQKWELIRTIKKNVRFKISAQPNQEIDFSPIYGTVLIPKPNHLRIEDVDPVHYLWDHRDCSMKIDYYLYTIYCILLNMSMVPTAWLLLDVSWVQNFCSFLQRTHAARTLINKSWTVATIWLLAHIFRLYSSTLTFAKHSDPINSHFIIHKTFRFEKLLISYRSADPLH